MLPLTIEWRLLALFTPTYYNSTSHTFAAPTSSHYCWLFSPCWQDLMRSKEFLLSLYTTCDYPLTVVDVSRCKVYRTASYKFHHIHQHTIREKQLLEILHPTTRPR